MFKKLKEEIKIVKWPTKKTVIKDCVITLIGSSVIMIALSLINMISTLLMGFIF